MGTIGRAAAGEEPTVDGERISELRRERDGRPLRPRYDIDLAPGSASRPMPLSAPSTESARLPRPLSPLRRLVYALLPLVVVLAVCELVLSWAGIAAEDNAYFSRGFDASARYLVPVTQSDLDPGAETGASPDPGSSTPGSATPAHTGSGSGASAGQSGQGTWVTRLYDGLHPEVVLPPKSDRRRVLLLGGSNVRRLAEGYLEQRLTELSPSDHPGWEVFNLGREGYGSERLAILAQQALVTEPDVVVIYSGHNEFIERRFATELDESMSSWERGAALDLSRLRTFRWLKSLWAAEPSTEHATQHGAKPDTADPAEQDVRTPEKFQLEVQSFRDLTWDGTLRYLEAYRRNLARMVEQAHEADAQVVLCTLVSNDFAPPVLTNPPPELSESEALKLVKLREFSIEAEDGSPIAGLALTRRLRWTEWTDNLDAPADYEPPKLRPLSGRLAQTPATTGPLSSIAGAHWTDPAGWSRSTIAAITAYQRLLNRDVDRGWLGLALLHIERCEEALTITPDDPDALYDLGICLLLTGQDDARAADLLRAAAAADRLPLAANGTINAIVRQVADASAANLLDADQLFRASSPHGLLGFEVMMDHCHLQPGAGQVLLQEVADQIIALDP